MREYLLPTAILDFEHPIVRSFAAKHIGSAKTDVEKAILLYRAVRDEIIYDPYTPFYKPEHYMASEVLKRRRGFCVPKAGLLCALLRGEGIPSRIGFATVRNHLITKQLLEFMGTDVFSFHAYTEIYLNKKWVKATPAFNRELCERHKVPVLEFDGKRDSLFQAYNLENKKFMEYIEFVGVFPDIPVEMIVRGWKQTYGEERVSQWIKAFEDHESHPSRDFQREDPLID